MKSIHITIGILLALGIIILGNIVIYEAVVRIFSFNHPTSIQIILGFLSFGFIAAVLIGIKYSNRVTRIFYLITSVWFGFSVYFFLASLTYLVIIILFGKEPRALGLAIILIPVFVGGYGVFRARDSKIKKVNIKFCI